MGIEFSAAESVPWNAGTVLSPWVHLCFSSAIPSVLPQGPDAGSALPPVPCPRAGCCSTPCPGTRSQPCKAQGGTEPLTPGSSPELDMCDQRRKCPALGPLEGTTPHPPPSCRAVPTSLLLTSLALLKSIVQIKESSGAVVQTPNWILGGVLEKIQLRVLL